MEGNYSRLVKQHRETIRLWRTYKRPGDFAKLMKQTKELKDIDKELKNHSRDKYSLSLDFYRKTIFCALQNFAHSLKFVLFKSKNK